MSFEHVRGAVFGAAPREAPCACDAPDDVAAGDAADGPGDAPPDARVAAEAVVRQAKVAVLFHRGCDCPHSASFLTEWNAFRHRTGAGLVFDFDTLAHPSIMRDFKAQLARAGYATAADVFATVSELPVGIVFERGAVKVLQGQSLRIDNFRR